MGSVTRLMRGVMSRGREARELQESLRAIWRGMTLAQAVDHIAAIRGDQVAVVLEEPLSLSGFEMREWTYKDLSRFVARASAVLFREARVRPDDKVAVCTSNRLDMPLLTLAVSRCGAVAVPLNHHLRAEEIRFIVEDSGARVLIADPAVLGDALAPWLEPGEAPEGLDIIVVSGHEEGLASRGDPELVGLWAQLGAGEGAPMPPCPTGDESVCAVFYTSGTTGFPKGAMLTSRSLLGDRRFLLGLPSLMPRTMLMALPMAHIMGFAMLLFGLMAGVRVVYLNRFRPDRVLDWMETGEIDGFMGVPSMYQMLEEAGAFERDLRGVKVFASAADVMPGALIERFKAAGRTLRLGGVEATFVEAYGSVELSGAAMLRVSPPGLSPSAGGFVGWPLPGYKVRILGEDGRQVPAGVVGELSIKGPGVLKGYLGRDKATRKTIDGDGWLNTGDLASRTRLGTVRFAGREKDVIKSGGYSVFPAEIETQLLQHPAVFKAAVVGISHPSKGAVPVAVVVLEANGEADPEAIREWIGLRVARYKVPRSVHILPESELPYGPTGKVLKRELSARLEALSEGQSPHEI